jgi:8-oxo-dGTP pyrophosphatase MutT (NUDIX family)
MSRRLFETSTKIALFNRDGKILVIYMDRNNDYGLPGGHIEEGETPDQAIKRELFEECNVTDFDTKHVDFFITSFGKLVLAYASYDNNDKIKSQQNGLEGIPKWLGKDEFEKIRIDPTYRDFALNNWPV